MTQWSQTSSRLPWQHHCTTGPIRPLRQGCWNEVPLAKRLAFQENDDSKLMPAPECEAGCECFLVFLIIVSVFVKEHSPPRLAGATRKTAATTPATAGSISFQCFLPHFGTARGVLDHFPVAMPSPRDKRLSSASVKSGRAPSSAPVVA